MADFFLISYQPKPWRESISRPIAPISSVTTGWAFFETWKSDTNFWPYHFGISRHCFWQKICKLGKRFGRFLTISSGHPGRQLQQPCCRRRVGWPQPVIHLTPIRRWPPGAEIFSQKKMETLRKNEILFVNQGDQGPMLWFFKIFSPKNSVKKLSFLNQNKAKICKLLITTLVFEKNDNFFAENCQKLQKIVIITSTPDWANFRLLGDSFLYK
jgi:hypothetical protein